METLLIILSILIIILGLLQSGKSEGASEILSGNADLFKERKERGSELVISRLTMVLGLAFFVICLVLSF